MQNVELENIGKKLSEKLSHIAVLDTDCLEQDGKFYVLEMNARFGGQYPFSHLAGADIPKQIIDWLYGLPTNPSDTNIDIDTLGFKDILPVKL
ncbi:hypothetical protein CAG54_07340 [Vibrio sp. V27_P1S3P104]|uniref:hypothetical protein n=1 Tax=Vibrio sp. V27_P1S3P104 TaxID=1938679 RepID=UPI0013733417|nr:hypothetical protein [Vibrio sp. V27_P1S3P104]NAX37315.1 hypothetical protein [Vibrio sp. V27_P1S3P104]